jgi:hypothetical protein
LLVFSAARHHPHRKDTHRGKQKRLKAFVAQGASVVKVAATLKRKIVRARALGCPFATTLHASEMGRYPG